MLNIKFGYFQFGFFVESTFSFSDFSYTFGIFVNRFKLHDFWICFRNKISHCSQEDSLWLNEHLDRYSLKQIQYCKNILKKFTCIVKNLRIHNKWFSLNWFVIWASRYFSWKDKGIWYDSMCFVQLKYL